MNDEPGNEHSKWPMRLAVISTIATVAALFTPFLMPYFTTSAEEEIKNVLSDPAAKDKIKEGAKEVLDDLKPVPPLPGEGGSKPPFGPPPFSRKK